jgi:DNA-binding CsgD family transcriptional regulator/PAS domain-containing protein
VRDDDVWINPEMVSAIYDAVAEPSMPLRLVMETFAREMRCDAAYFKLVNRTSGAVVAAAGGGMADGSDRDYLENYLPTDVRVGRVDRAPRRVLLDDRQVITSEERRRSAFHQEWLRRYDVEHLMHINISPARRYTGIVTCAQARARGEFDIRQGRLLMAYVPHFERAAALQIRLAELGDRAVLMSGAFDRLPVAGIILDASGTVLFANALAAEVLEARDGLGLRNGRLAAQEKQTERAFARRLRQIASAVGPEPDPPAPIPVARPSGRAPYRVDVLPLPTASGFHRNEAGATVLVLIHDPTQRRQLRRYELSFLYGLTPAEAALAEAVVAGETLREYAERKGRSIGTVRHQMKQVLAKTECHRQADLIRLVGT